MQGQAAESRFDPLVELSQRVLRKGLCADLHGHVDPLEHGLNRALRLVIA
jgi:hypothetical protein